MEKDAKKGQLSTRLTNETAPLYEWFRKNFRRVNDSQLLNTAMEYYIADIRRYGMDVHTWLPKAPHIEPSDPGHLHAAEGKESYKKKGK